MNATSVTLLEQLRQPGPSQDAWVRFVHLYTPLLFFWSRKLGMRDAEAADLVQDVFAILVQKLPNFEYDQHKGFRNWLRTVLLNKWRNHLRNKPPLVLDNGYINAAADPHDPEALTEAEYQEHLLSHALEFMRGQFSDKTWKACWEHVVMGRPAVEVAAELEISVGTVYVAKSRVVSRLRQQMAGLFD